MPSRRRAARRGQVEDQERAHPVVREALPHLGEEQRRQARWVAEERRIPVLGHRARNLSQIARDVYREIKLRRWHLSQRYGRSTDSVILGGLSLDDDTLAIVGDLAKIAPHVDDPGVGDARRRFVRAFVARRLVSYRSSRSRPPSGAAPRVERLALRHHARREHAARRGRHPLRRRRARRSAGSRRARAPRRAHDVPDASRRAETRRRSSRRSSTSRRT